MLGTMARYTFLLTIAVMFVVWAVSLSRSEPQDPNKDWPTEPWSIYC